MLKPVELETELFCRGMRLNTTFFCNPEAHGIHVATCPPPGFLDVILCREVTVVTGSRAPGHGAKSVPIAILLIARRCAMCLGAPGQIIEVNGRTALTDFWGTRKVVKLDSLTDRVVPGDYILNHEGSAVRRISPELVADTMALYELLLCEAGEDPLATDIVAELEETETMELVTA